MWNYFGSILPLFQLLKKHDDAEVFLFIASMHAYTTLHDAAQLQNNTMSVLKLYRAMMQAYWLADEKIRIFNSVDVPWHAQLAWVFQCLTNMWFMERMHAYKDAVAHKKAGEVSVGTFTYPILMAIDILLYDTACVPVWKDQKQHVEYARDMAQKFNHLYGETFVLPEPIIQESVATITGTDWRKMSKSYNNYIWLLDDAETIRKKVARIPTAALSIDQPKNPDEDNIYAIHKHFLTTEEDQQLRQQYIQWWLSYKDAKQALADRIIAFVEPIQWFYNQIDEEALKKMLTNNADYCNQIAQRKIQDVYQKIWFNF